MPEKFDDKSSTLFMILRYDNLMSDQDHLNTTQNHNLSHKSDLRSKFRLGGAIQVAVGIFLSRIMGLVRLRALAHFLGDSAAGDAFYAALKIPNFPQNLLGEGVLSASFIPVYANLIAKDKKEEAGQVAGAILALLAIIVSFIVIFGVWLTPQFIEIVAPGFDLERKLLTISLVRIIFPGTGLLVLSAWCLGILNSHGRFFLSYVAPVVSNISVIIALILFRHETNLNQLAIYASWGLVLGSLLQFLVQLPSSLKLINYLKLNLNIKLNSIREILKNFVPVVFSRGVVQLSAYIDSILASYLPSGAVAVLGYTQAIYMLPISLFGMSVSAAELPTMSKSFGDPDFSQRLQKRINDSSRKIAFFVIPTVAGFLLLGDVIASLLFQTGQFDEQTSSYVWMVLGGSAIGLLASTLGRLYSSAFYSLRDTKTPLKYSMIRVFLTTGFGYIAALKLPVLLSVDLKWGTAFLTASSGFAGWIEFYLLRRKLNQLIGLTGLNIKINVQLWGASLISGLVAYLIKDYINLEVVFIKCAMILIVFVLIYFPLTLFLGLDESKIIFQKIKTKFLK